jgi:hypothetical protein
VLFLVRYEMAGCLSHGGNRVGLFHHFMKQRCGGGKGWGWEFSRADTHSCGKGRLKQNGQFFGERRDTRH